VLSKNRQAEEFFTSCLASEITSANSTAEFGNSDL